MYVDTCVPLDETACNTNPACTWDPIILCRASRPCPGLDENACNTNPACRYDPIGLMCMTISSTNSSNNSPSYSSPSYNSSSYNTGKRCIKIRMKVKLKGMSRGDFDDNQHPRAKSHFLDKTSKFAGAACGPTGADGCLPTNVQLNDIQDGDDGARLNFDIATDSYDPDAAAKGALRLLKQFHKRKGETMQELKTEQDDSFRSLTDVGCLEYNNTEAQSKANDMHGVMCSKVRGETGEQDSTCCVTYFRERA